MTNVGIPLERLYSSPGAAARFEMTTRTAASSWPESQRLKIARRLVPCPEINTPIGSAVAAERESGRAPVKNVALLEA